MKTSDILNRAAEIMMERPFYKGTMAADEIKAGAVCTSLALDAACGENDVANYFAAQSILTASIGIDDRAAAIFKWNDRPETTAAMAIGALHEAALLAKEAGQ